MSWPERAVCTGMRAYVLYQIAFIEAIQLTPMAYGEA